MASRGRVSFLAEARGVLHGHGLNASLGSVTLDDEEVGGRTLSRAVKTAQLRELSERLKAKVIHGVHRKQVTAKETDVRATHWWLSSGRLRSETEALIIAAQDGVILTAA